MRVEALDHVNILTRDVDASARFYAELLELDPRQPNPNVPPEMGRWLYDGSGHPIIHLFNNGAAPDSEAGTGAVHHVALRCSGLQETRDRLDARGIGYRINEVPAAGLTQLFTRDPHGVLLELNFGAG